MSTDKTRLYIEHVCIGWYTTYALESGRNVYYGFEFDCESAAIKEIVLGTDVTVNTAPGVLVIGNGEWCYWSEFREFQGVEDPLYTWEEAVVRNILYRHEQQRLAPQPSQPEPSVLKPRGASSAVLDATAAIASALGVPEDRVCVKVTVLDAKGRPAARDYHIVMAEAKALIAERFNVAPKSIEIKCTF